MAAQLKFSNKLLPEKQIKGSLDTCKCTSYGWIHSPVFNKMQASTEAFSILGALSRSLPWISGASWGLLWRLSLSFITARAHIYTQNDTVNLISQGNEAKHAKNYFLSPHSTLVAVPWYHSLHITSLPSTTHILHVSPFPLPYETSALRDGVVLTLLWWSQWLPCLHCVLGYKSRHQVVCQVAFMMGQ